MNGAYDTVRARSVLGFFTAQLNRPSPGNPAVNQLQDFLDKGWLRGLKPGSWADAPRWYSLRSKEPGESLDKRARSYLGANCSGCHGETGFAFGMARGPDFDFHEMKAKSDLEYMNAGWDRNLGDVAPAAPPDDPLLGVYVFTPRYPQKSVALHRLKDRNTAPPDSVGGWDPGLDQMPPLASFERDTAAIAVLSEWVTKMEQRTVSIRFFAAAGAPRAASFRGRTLVLPANMALGNAKVTLAGIDGREVALIRRGIGAYDMPAGTPAGVYIIRVGSAAFTRSLL